MGLLTTYYLLLTTYYLLLTTYYLLLTTYFLLLTTYYLLLTTYYKVWTIPFVAQAEHDETDWPVLMDHLGVASSRSRVGTNKRKSIGLNGITAQALMSDPLMHRAVCSMLQREYACLRYYMGPCAMWNSSEGRSGGMSGVAAAAAAADVSRP